MSKRYKAVLFDYDGTVMDTNRIIVESWNYMYNKYCGGSVSDDDVKWTFGMLLADAIDAVMRKMGHSEYDLNQLVADYREYQTYKAVTKPEPFEGIVDTVKALKAKGFILGIVTSRTRNTCLSGLEDAGILEDFGYIVAADSTDNHKPLPDPALICCEGLGIEPKDALMVGDSVFDLQCANTAGCGSCFVTWSFATPREKAVTEGNPDFVVDKAEEIIAIAEGLC